MNKKLLRKKLALMLANPKKKRPYYCELEFLESTGTQYIDTGLLSTANSKVDCVFGFSSMESGSANNAGVFGGRSVQVSNTFTFFKIASATPQYFRFDYNGQTTVGTATEITWNTSSKYRFQYDGTNCVTTNTTTGESVVVTKSPGSTFTTSPICLFAVNTDGTIEHYLSGRIYHYWYTDGTNTIDLIPVLDWNYTPCMYDKVSCQLFYNAGSGEFSYGREIHYVDYLEATGTQYILTGFKPTVNTDYEIELSSTNTGTNTWVMGCATWIGVHYKQSGANQIGVTNSSIAAYQQYVTYTPDNSRITMKLQGNTVYANGSVLGTITRAAGTQNLAIFGYQTNATQTQLPFIGSIYKTKIWDNDVLVRDYVPAIDENGVGFMFDSVSHTIYDNAGTGVFKYPAKETEYTANANTPAYIDLGVKYKPSMSIRGKYVRNSSGASGSVIMLTTSTSSPVLYLPALSGIIQERFVWRRSGYSEQGYYINNITYPYENEVEIDAVNDTLSLNGTIVKTGMIAGMNGYDSPYESSSNMYMFSIIGSYSGDGYVEYLQIDDNVNGQVVPLFNLIPCFLDGEAGFLNKVDGTFYGNVSTNSNAKLTGGKIIEPEYE